MSTQTPMRPALLVEYMQKLQAGDDKHQVDHPMPKGVRTAVDSSLRTLQAAMKDVQSAKGEYQKAKQRQDEALQVARQAARNMRKQVRANFETDDRTVFDYGLSTPVSHRKVDDEKKPEVKS